jgi:hypothetical protein
MKSGWWGIANVLEHLFSKHEVLNSNPRTACLSVYASLLCGNSNILVGNLVNADFPKLR